ENIATPVSENTQPEKRVNKERAAHMFSQSENKPIQTTQQATQENRKTENLDTAAVKLVIAESATATVPSVAETKTNTSESVNTQATTPSEPSAPSAPSFAENIDIPVVSTPSYTHTPAVNPVATQTVVNANAANAVATQTINQSTDVLESVVKSEASPKTSPSAEVDSKSENHNAGNVAAPIQQRASNDPRANRN